jgi:succinate dehydrogenase / fumarate reductase, flavoprotein subunit
VARLYVAGGLGGHSNGLIALATYDGKVAAQAIADDLLDSGLGDISQTSIDAEQKRLEQLLQPSKAGGEIAPARLKDMLRKIMWDKAGVEKDESMLKRALNEIEELKIELLPRMRTVYKGRTANYEWLDAIDLVNMIDACELIIHSSLERRESRGPFMRSDFPLTDNEHWLAANIMIKTGNGFRFERRPYELPFFQPGFTIKDNLEVAW